MLERDLIMLLQSVAINDLSNAKLFADNYARNNADSLPPDFYEWLLQCLADRQQAPSAPKYSDLGAPNIPSEVAPLIVHESVEDLLYKFNPRRYWVSKREAALLEDIISMCRTGEALAKAQIPYSNTTLLYGMPGTGKTQFGRYVAYALKRPFVFVNLCRVSVPHQGEPGRNLQMIFDFVQTFPCIFVMDEIDAIGANRGAINMGGSGDEASRTTLALMQCMDRVRQDVVIIATTNRADMLDSALKRRFSVQHEVKPFLQDERLEMVLSYLEDVKETGSLDISWEYEDIKKQCSSIGMPQSEVINLCNRAVIRALRTDKVVSLKDTANLVRTTR